MGLSCTEELKTGLFDATQVAYSTSPSIYERIRGAFLQLTVTLLVNRHGGQTQKLCAEVCIEPLQVLMLAKVIHDMHGQQSKCW